MRCSSVRWVARSWASAAHTCALTSSISIGSVPNNSM